jgi:CubicO group peptidase (beta-lactamase class C family)
MTALGQSTPNSPLPSDEEVRNILIQRIDGYKQSVGIVVGLLEGNGRRIVSYGTLEKNDKRPVDGNTIFEIGSITKVFTSLLLADMVQRHELSLDDPISKFLPASVKTPERGGRQITLQDLATHTSGLPRLPTNFQPKDPANPYADFSEQNLFNFLSSYTLPRDIGAQYEYSNLGGGLLGYLLARRAGKDYETLLRERVIAPLGLKSTFITVPSELKVRFAVGHNEDLQSVPYWDMPTLAGAGALRSTANDLLTFLAANFQDEESPLKPAMKEMLSVRRQASPGLQVALGWHIFPRNGAELIWHNGGTYGFSSFVGYDPGRHVGVVVLSNAFITSGASIGVDDIGLHILDSKFPLNVAPQRHIAITIDDKILNNYIGQYQLAPNFVLTVTHETTHLMLQATGQPKFEIFPEADKEFFAKLSGISVSFQTDEQGHVTGLILHQNGRDTPAKRLP